MRNAAATGKVAHSGYPFMRAYIHAPSASSNHPAPSPTASPARFVRPGEFGIAVMIALGCLVPLRALEPPADVAKRVAHRESQTAEERRQYAYTQSVKLQEIDGR